MGLFDREKDAKVAAALGWQVRWVERTHQKQRTGQFEVWVKRPDSSSWCKCPDFSWTMGDTWIAVKDARRLGLYIDIHPYVDYFHAVVRRGDGKGEGVMVCFIAHRDAPDAVCDALLIAVGAEVPPHGE